MRNLCRACAAAMLVALVAASTASAHATLSPSVSLSKRLQLYSLAVPTEKEGATTAKIVLTVPQGFSIDSFAPSPGWHRVVQSTGSGEEAVVQQVTWTGGSVPTGEDSLFQFLAQPSDSKTYTFTVKQTYSDGSVVDWNGSESSESPAPTIEAKSSLGGGGTSTLTVVALALGVAGVVLGATALLFRPDGKRALA
jgi:periplasmic copper chaperone A